MSLGLPGHLAPHSESRAFARASHAISFVILIADVLLILTLQSAKPWLILWPAAVALLPIIAALWLLDKYRSWFYTVSYLIIGTASLYWLVLAGTSQFPADSVTDSIVFTLPKIALIMVGGAGIGVTKTIAWAALGYLLGASPGASTAAPIMLGLIETCFPERIEAWRPHLTAMVPSFGTKLSDDPALADAVMTRTAQTLRIPR